MNPSLGLASARVVDRKVARTKIEIAADDVFFSAPMGFVVVCDLIFSCLRRLQSTSLRY
jgi:hypothetical protein